MTRQKFIRRAQYTYVDRRDAIRACEGWIRRKAKPRNPKWCVDPFYGPVLCSNIGDVRHARKKQP